MIKFVFLFSGLLADISHFNSPKGKFQFELDCDQSKEMCAEAEKCFRLSSRFIENALDITTPITVQAEFSSTRDNVEWSSPYLLGLGYFNSIIVEERGYFSYPQAIIKQSKNYQQLHNPFDLRISINPTANFYYPKDFNRKQTPNEFNILDTITHELFHGMGFATAASQILGVNNGYSLNVIPTPFDKIVTTTDGRTLAQLINSKDPQSIETLRQLAVTDNSMYFNTTNGKFYLETSNNPFKEGSSISHIHARYSNTHDYLMTQNAPNLFGIPEHMRDMEWKTSPIGPKLLEVFVALGYKTNPSPSFNDSMLATMHKASNDFSYDASSHPTYEQAPNNNPTKIQSPPKMNSPTSNGVDQTTTNRAHCTDNYSVYHYNSQVYCFSSTRASPSIFGR